MISVSFPRPSFAYHANLHIEFLFWKSKWMRKDNIGQSCSPFFSTGVSCFRQRSTTSGAHSAALQRPLLGPRTLGLRRHFFCVIMSTWFAYSSSCWPVFFFCFFSEFFWNFFESTPSIGGCGHELFCVADRFARWLIIQIIHVWRMICENCEKLERFSIFWNFFISAICRVTAELNSWFA